MKKVNDTQVGGSHYKRAGDYQHWDWVVDLSIPFLEGNAAKYVARCRYKGCKDTDLKKAIHYLEKIKEVRKKGLLKSAYLSSPDALAYVDKLCRRYAKSAELTENEHKVIRILATWESLEDIQTAIVIIKAM